MADSAPSLVRFEATHMDRRALGGRGLPIDQSLVPGRELATLYTDRLEFVDLLGDGKECADWPKGLTAEVHDRKSTRLNSSHVAISYAVYCLKKKTNKRLISKKTNKVPTPTEAHEAKQKREHTTTRKQSSNTHR